MEPPSTLAAVVADDRLTVFVVKHLSPVDIVRAALACRRWCRSFAFAIPRAPPLLGYLCHPEASLTSPLLPPIELSSVFVLRDAPSTNLSVPLAPEDPRDLQIHDVHLGLVLLLPHEIPGMPLLRVLAVDPASGRRFLLSPPPRDTLPEEQWRQTRHFIGAAVLSRAHPSKLRFEVVCLTLDDDSPRAWIAFVEDGTCRWRALSRSKQPDDPLDLTSFGRRCARAGGNLVWRICNSDRLLALHPLTLELSLLPSRAKQENPFDQYTS
ncbi:hypothetical protein PR202_gb11031 [Eleusine coracana subsp. coracana]|uniref:Uncharacterized protein n=1 Tax=Eleusine coracana subsp. coracana TaxID=191504 RepID=A0AAV5EMF0_ELECO|nr:hypothetical protein PR202_gb11031 [Eleusine coracana subsp. coracana]